MEQFQVRAILALEYTIEVLHQDAKEIGGILFLLEQETDRHIKHLACLEGLSFYANFVSKILKSDIFNDLGNEFDKIRVILQGGVSNHAYDTQGISNLSDKLSELIQECLV